MMVKRFIIFSLLFAFLISFGIDDLYAQAGKRSVRKIERSMKGSKRKTPKQKKIREPKAVVKAKKEQSKKEAKQDKAYEKSVKQNRDRHYKIQTDEVKERMKQNEKDIKLRDRERKKQQRKSQKKSGAARKYRKK